MVFRQSLALFFELWTLADDDLEDDESYIIQFGNPVNATIVPEEGGGVYSVTVYDVTPNGGGCVNPTLDVEDDVTNEGDVFPLDLSASNNGGCTIAGYDIHWGDGSSQYISAQDPLEHIYEDDDPTSTASDPHTISVVAYWQDGQSVSDTATILVRNFAPTLTIDSFPATVEENSTFTIQGEITDPGVLDTIESAILYIDLNFDGDTADDGEHDEIDLELTEPGHWQFSHPTTIVDDGATFDEITGDRIWGNESSSDDLDFSIVLFDDDSGVGNTSETIEVLKMWRQTSRRIQFSCTNSTGKDLCNQRR